MIKVDKNLVENIAKLSRIKLEPEEITEITPQLSTVIESVKTLKEVDTSKIKAKSLLNIKFIDLREDIVESSLTTGDALKNAPLTEDNYVKVLGTTFGGPEES